MSNTDTSQHGAETMTKEQILSLECVTSSKDWTAGNMDRTYLTLAGQDNGRSCRANKIYWDNNRGELVINVSTGRYTAEYREAVETLATLTGQTVYLR